MTALTRQRGALASQLFGAGPGADWRDHAACIDEDPDLWFPAGEFGPVKPAVIAQIAAAKAVCADWPVTAQCLTYAIENGEDWGIWGGQTRHERRSQALARTRIRERKCQRCGVQFWTMRARFCGKTCRDRAFHARQSSSRVGASR